MLRCRDMAREATDFIDGQMGWRRRLGAWFHLFICTHCRRFVRQLKIVRGLGPLRGAENADDAEVKQVVEKVCGHGGH